MHDWQDLKWKGRELRRHSGRLMATIEPDGNFAGMYRVRLPNGHVTDMVNLPRAKDAAIVLALAELNRLEGRNKPSAAPPMRSTLQAAE